MERSREVIVIGGGPAGAAAARLLGSWGHDVLLLTRRGSRERALAESLPPSCAKLLSRVGLSSTLEAAGFVRSTGNTVRWGNADERVEMFGAGAVGYQVDRSTFDALMLSQARVAGADVRRSAVVRSVRQTAGVRSVTFDYRGQTRTAESQWVLDCSGRAGLVARRGRRQPEQGARTMAIVGVWERHDGWPLREESHTLVESYAGGWGWSVPVSATKRFVTLMVDPAITALGSRPHFLSTYDRELSKTVSLRNLVVGARRVGRPFARDASPYTANRFCEEGALLVGDAGSFVDPLSSYGVKKAFASAWLAAIVTHTCLATPAISEPALALFESREREMYRILRQRASALAQDAAAAHPAGFWESRTSADRVDADGADEPDVGALRRDADVIEALEELRRRASIRLARSPSARCVRRPVVRGNRVVIEDHLVVPAFPDGIRYVRNIDLVRLSELAVSHDQVSDVFEAYNHSAPPASLPDFLGALSLLIGKGILMFA